MSRWIKYALLALAAAAVAYLVIELRRSRAQKAGIEGDADLPGSFDTWPDVPSKQPA
jgi:hypothetical protein